MFTVGEAVERWLDNMFELPTTGQTLLIPEGRAHQKLVSFRVTNKTFSVLKLNPSLLMYPDGYRSLDLSKYEGYDGTIPRISAHLPKGLRREILRDWLSQHADEKVVLLYGPEEEWREIGEAAGLPVVSDFMTVSQLGEHFNLENGEKWDREVRWPQSIQLFFDELTSEDETKLIEFASSNPL